MELKGGTEWRIIGGTKNFGFRVYKNRVSVGRVYERLLAFAFSKLLGIKKGDFLSEPENIVEDLFVFELSLASENFGYSCSKNLSIPTKAGSEKKFTEESLGSK